MIKQIEKVKNFGIFKDFRWRSEIPDFKQYNLLYGWNYSGKTMLSRIFRVIELDNSHPDFIDAEFILIDYNNIKISKHNQSSSQCKARVFNTDFIKDNLYWDEQEANPIFILGEKDIKLELQMKKLEDEIQQLSEKKTDRENGKIALEKDLEQKLSDRARELDRIRPPYDKRKLRNALDKIKGNPKKYCLEKQKIDRLIKTLKSTRKEKINLIKVLLINDILINDIRDNLYKTVVSKANERLKNDPKLNSWIREGIDIHRDKNRCEFCMKPLSDDLLKTYEEHFSDEYEKFIESLIKLKKNVESLKPNIELPDEMRLYPKLENEYKSVKKEFEDSNKKYNLQIQTLIQLLKEKIRNPFKKSETEINSFQSQRREINWIFKEINNILKNHNKITDNYEQEQEQAFVILELHYASEFDIGHKYFESRVKLEGLGTEIRNIKNEIKNKEKEITKIETELSDISRAADRVNDYLRSIFGKEHLKIEPTEKNKFQILRRREKAKNLSEGEKTSIAFSYFLTRLEDKETNVANTIIFIDDPISSLDSSHLYNTFAVIQSKLALCEQLFISTHNLEFFNLIKEWLKKERGHREKCSFYLIERILKSGEEIADIRELPKTLLDYRSEYHFLFNKIRSFANTPSTDFEDLFQLPNVIRRFLEAFIGFKYGVGLKKGLEFIINKEIDRIKVNKFVDNLSHQTGLQRNLLFCDISECKRVVDIVIEAIQKKDLEHFDTLERIYKDARE